VCTQIADIDFSERLRSVRVRLRGRAFVNRAAPRPGLRLQSLAQEIKGYGHLACETVSGVYC
jgi:hypothetical protein